VELFLGLTKGFLGNLLGLHLLFQLLHLVQEYLYYLFLGRSIGDKNVVIGHNIGKRIVTSGLVVTVERSNVNV